MLLPVLLSLAFSGPVSSHVAAWGPGMHCMNGNDSSINDQNTNLAVNPLYNLSRVDWWFQHDRGCDAVPPADNSILELPAGGSFAVELAINRAFTTLSYDGKFVTNWPDGENHTEPWVGPGNPPECYPNGAGALHTQNETMAAGTAWAISYHSSINEVTMEDLVVFSVLPHTPFRRLATYSVPSKLPACPEGGCVCAWLWVPNGCGQPNMYMQPYKCNVTNTSSTARLARAQAPVYCGDDQTKCVKGAKQMIAWNQFEGDNIETEPGVSPGYNEKCGYTPGAQDDIFEETETASTTSIAPEPSASSTSTEVAAAATSTITAETGTLPTTSSGLGSDGDASTSLPISTVTPATPTEPTLPTPSPTGDLSGECTVKYVYEDE